MSTGNEWLSSLQVGDEVILARGEMVNWLRARVSRLTKTIVEVGSYGEQFRREDGQARGRKWDRTHLRQATPEALAEMESAISEAGRRGAALNIIRSAVWRRFPTDTLEAVARLLAPTNESESEG